MDAWVDRFPEQYVTRIYSQTVGESGDQMVQHFFMAPRYGLAPNAYMLDLSQPGASKITRRFPRSTGIVAENKHPVVSVNAPIA